MRKLRVAEGEAVVDTAVSTDTPTNDYISQIEKELDSKR
jgi:hypothetical protein